MALFTQTSTRNFVLAILFSLSFLAATTQAQTTTSASLYPAPTGWTYYGCWNETSTINGTQGNRALNGGLQQAYDAMDVPTCLSYCKSNAFSFAGLEYTRECYCAQYLSALSNKLPESSCTLPCMGNSSQICGGSLAVTVYTTKTATKGSAVTVANKAPMGSILALGIAMGFALCLT